MKRNENIMKINSTILILILNLWLCSMTWAGGCQTGFSSPGTCNVTSNGTTLSCAGVDVQNAVNTVSGGDTVQLKASCSATWTSLVTITKPIILKGGGAGSTVITATSASGGINYTPASPNPTNRFRITDLSITSSGGETISINNATATKEYIRLDHNNITSTGSFRAIHTTGTVFGVIDNNSIATTARFTTLNADGNVAVQWDNFTQEYGTINNLYYEDNVITSKWTIMEAGAGGRYVLRYNTLANSGTSTVYAFDAHGNQGVTYQNLSTMVVEIYGNSFNFNGAGGQFLDHRGGWAALFSNLFTNVSGKIYHNPREESADNLWGSTYVMKITNSYYWANLINNSTQVTIDYSWLNGPRGQNCCTKREAWQPNHAYGSGYCAYITGDPNGNCWSTADDPWSTTGPSGSVEPNWALHPNRKDALHDNQVTWVNLKAGTPFVENVDLFVQKTGTFDGTGVTGGGVGCGTTLPRTCTTGVGFWIPNATMDASATSCTNLTDYVGAANAKARAVNGAIGTLYKCTATNVWTPYYTPLPYPHPLRSGEVVESPKGFKVGS